MRLKYEKRLFLHKQKYKKSNHLKSTSMDNILLPQKSKNQCLNKLPQKNQVNSKLSSEKTYLKDRRIILVFVFISLFFIGNTIAGSVLEKEDEIQDIDGARKDTEIFGTVSDISFSDNML